MSEAIGRVAILEQRTNQLDFDLRQALDRIARLETMLSALRLGPGGGSGSGGAAFFCDAVVIAAGSSVTGQTISKLVGGSVTTVTTNGTVYNQMAAATDGTSGRTIALVANGDGTYLAVSQSCAP